jgi:hypothetical protein
MTFEVAETAFEVAEKADDVVLDAKLVALEAKVLNPEEIEPCVVAPGLPLEGTGSSSRFSGTIDAMNAGERRVRKD